MPKQLERLEDLTPDPGNANAGTERGAIQVENSLRDYGAGRSIVVDKDGVVIAGNKTLESAADIGLPIEVVRTDGTKLVVVQRTDLQLGSEDNRARLLAYADNRASEVGLEWNVEQVALDLEGGVDLSELFRQDEIDELLASVTEPPEEPPEPQTDRADELREKWQTERGQVWEIGRHRLMCGDCTEAGDVGKVLDGHKPFIMVTDPPYGMNYTGLTGEPQSGMVAEQRRHVTPVTGDDNPFDPMPAIDLVQCREVFVWGGDWFYDKLPPGGSWIVWDKRATDAADAIPGSPFEVCWSRNRHAREFIRKPWGGWNNTEAGETVRHHPTQKPVECMALPMRNHSDESSDVYDPFLGSGTTMVAAEQLNRICYGMEIEPKYVAVALERMADMGLEPELANG